MAITLVSGQVVVAETSSPQASVTATLPNNPTPGNLVVALFSYDDSTNTISSIQDSAATPNNYTLTTGTPFHNTTPSANSTGIAYLANAPSSATKSVTLTIVGNSVNLNLWLAEFSGAATSPFESSATNSSATAGTTINLPSLTTVNNGDLLVGTCFVSGAVSSANSPWTEISTIPASGSGAEYFIQTSAGAQAVGWTASSSTWSAIEAAFKAAASTVAPIPFPQKRIVYRRLT